MIEAKGLAKQFGNRLALQSITFSVDEGEIYGLLGRNGAGKTTTVRILACLLRPTAGDGRSPDTTSSPRRAVIRARVGILDRRCPACTSGFRPGNTWISSATCTRYQRPIGGRAPRNCCGSCGLWDVRGLRLRAFSKGMKQKVAIARALLHKPRVVFFDEPTAALDPESAKTVRDYLQYLAEERRVTVLLCTHNLAEAERLCRRLSIVRGGRQIAEGTPVELKATIGQRMILRLRESGKALLDALRAVDGVEDVDPVDGRVYFKTGYPERVNPLVVSRLVAQGGEIVTLEAEDVQLEDVYLAFVRDIED